MKVITYKLPSTPTADSVLYLTFKHTNGNQIDRIVAANSVAKSVLYKLARGGTLLDSAEFVKYLLRVQGELQLEVTHYEIKNRNVRQDT
jgi:hypothetical protein